MHAYNNFSFVYHRCATSLLPWQVIGPFNMALDDINKMLEEARNQALISVAINAGANMLIGYWTSSYQKAVEQVWKAPPLFDNVIVRHLARWSSLKLWLPSCLQCILRWEA